MKKTVFGSFLILTMVSMLCQAVENSPHIRFNKAKSLQKKGQEEEAFRRYLTLPGAEYAAVALARSTPQKYLEILESPNKDALVPIVALIEGDLALATGDRKKALSCYRSVTASIATTEEEDWDTGHMPPDYYPVEPASENRLQNQLLQPFMVGPGSHRDNWLIRRFIALDAMDDAAQEFDRIWNLHHKALEPYVVSRAVFDLRQLVNEAQKKPYLFTPAGYNGRALQFSLDYAYFLKRQGHAEKSIAILLPPLLSVDMDIDPNTSSHFDYQLITEEEAKTYPKHTSSNLVPDFGGWGYSAGISRKEFIRLVYGEFKQTGKEQDLVEVLQKNIADGKNRSRRVLARIRLHQGRIDDAIALELDYIENGGFDPFSATYRRGLVYEDLQRPKEAAIEYEKLLVRSTEAAIDLPDPDEASVHIGQRLFGSDWISPADPRWLAKHKTKIANRLQRIYAAQGETDKLLSLSLVQFDLNPGLLEEFDAVQKTVARFKATGHESEFKTWAADRATASENPSARANLYWALGDPVKTAEALKTCRSTRDLHPWKRRFKEEGEESFRMLLNVALSINPGDSQTRMELLDLEESPLGKEAIDSLEVLLAVDAESAFPRGKGAHRGTKFHNDYDLAYRLMRLYEKENQIDQLQVLGLRVALSGKPFTKLKEIDRTDYSYRNEDGLAVSIGASLSLLLHHADDTMLEQISSAWKDIPDFPAKHQLERKRNGGFKLNKSEKPFAWANIPEGIKLFTSNENVLSLARDDRHVYAGHPWGVAVYDHAGNPVVRIALGTAALHLEMCNNMLWVGTPIGLTRIEPETWAVAYLALNQDIPANKRDIERKAFENGVCSLACDGNSLWIGTRRNIQCLDTKNRSLRIFSKDELHVQGHNDWNYFIIENDSVWVNGYHGVHRYDRKAKIWSKVQYHDTDVHLIGLLDGKLFGHVHLKSPLGIRPCLINRDTLEVTPILIDETLAKDQRRVSLSNYFGTYHGNLAFGSSHPSFFFDKASCKLKPMGTPWERKDDPIDNNNPPGLRSGSVRQSASGVLTCVGRMKHRHTVFGKPFHAKHWNLLTLPDGTRVLGGEHPDSPRYIYPNKDWPFSNMPKTRPSHSGGLHFISTNQQIRCVSSRPHADTILGDTVFSIVDDPEKKRLWLCTDSGLSILNDHHAVLANIQQTDGLCANRITSGAVIGNKIYFSSAWRDHSGGLITYDPETNIFTTRHQSDGLATDKLASIENDGGKIKLTYATEYLRRSNNSFRYRLHPPGSFDPKTKAVTSSKPAKLMKQPEQRSPAKRTPMPYLGGFILSEQTLNEKTYTCGTRGMIVSKGPFSPPPPVELRVAVVKDENLRLIQEANALKIKKPISMVKFKELIQHDNPYIRAKALASAQYTPALKNSDEFIPLVGKLTTHPCIQVKRTALYALTRCENNEELIPIFEHALLDPDQYVRAMATTCLCKRGVLPELKHMQELYRYVSTHSSYDRGAIHYSGIIVNKISFCEAVAPHASPEVFTLLMEAPPIFQNYDNETKIFPQLGVSLRRHPEAAHLLLQAYDHDKHNPYKRDFARHIFHFAGTDLLNILHTALESDDRIVRSNAARGCGAIGDASSIPHLIKAMELESGLSRASIVWALGELKAKEARPMLETLYVTVRNDEERIRHAGFGRGQLTAVMQSHYDTLQNLEAIGSEWNELKDAALPPPTDPIKNEDLLSTKGILDALRKIDPAASQVFYRTLAGEKNREARREAARQLAYGTGNNRDRNLPVLRNLLIEKDWKIRMRASVSLLILKEESAKPLILEWFKDKKAWEERTMLEELRRVGNPEEIAFAQTDIETLVANETDPYLARILQNLVDELFPRSTVPRNP